MGFCNVQKLGLVIMATAYFTGIGVLLFDLLHGFASSYNSKNPILFSVYNSGVP